MSRRLLLANSNSAGGGSITFYVNDIAYEAQAGMTWEEWIDSDYNPYLPNGSQKLFSKMSDSGKYSGYVWFHIWDYEVNQIDISREIIATSAGLYVINLSDKIIQNCIYEV